MTVPRGGKPPEINMKAIARDEKKDGFFGVATNIEGMSATEIIAYYKNLWKVEDAFGELKGTLQSRPVFHWTDRRIVGHLIICFTAYLCEATLTKRLRESGAMLKDPAIDKKTIAPRPLTVVEALKELREIRAIPVTIRGGNPVDEDGHFGQCSHPVPICENSHPTKNF